MRPTDVNETHVNDPAATAVGSRTLRRHDQVVDAVGRRIVTGVLPPGATIVPEKLRTEFAVSASVVREAFRALQEKGLLRAKSKVGTKVLASSHWNFLDPQVILWRFESSHRDEQIAEFFEVRLALEPVAAQLIADRGDPATVARLRECIARMKDAAQRDDLAAFVRADVEYHATLVAESGNQMLATLRGIVELAVSVREMLFFPFSGLEMHELSQHEQVVDDIEAGSATAWQTARTLLISARDELRDELALRERERSRS
jgi:DNA-binding FadR family transcriptional regulator